MYSLLPLTLNIAAHIRLGVVCKLYPIFHLKWSINHFNCLGIIIVILNYWIVFLWDLFKIFLYYNRLFPTFWLYLQQILVSIIFGVFSGTFGYDLISGLLHWLDWEIKSKEMNILWLSILFPNFKARDFYFKKQSVTFFKECIWNMHSYFYIFGPYIFYFLFIFPCYLLHLLFSRLDANLAFMTKVSLLPSSVITVLPKVLCSLTAYLTDN